MSQSGPANENNFLLLQTVFISYARPLEVDQHRCDYLLRRYNYRYRHDRRADSFSRCLYRQQCDPEMKVFPEKKSGQNKIFIWILTTTTATDLWYFSLFCVGVPVSMYFMSVASRGSEVAEWLAHWLLVQEVPGSIIEDSAPCHGCQKAINKGGNGVCCNFCEHWYCLTCSKLKKVVYQALKNPQIA